MERASARKNSYYPILFGVRNIFDVDVFWKVNWKNEYWISDIDYSSQENVYRTSDEKITTFYVPVTFQIITSILTGLFDITKLV